MSEFPSSPETERTPSDAPVWLDADEANAWADGYNAAIEAFRVAQCQQVTELPPLVDRGELIALLEDLASVNLSREACERQARRMADDLIARGLSVSSTLCKREDGK